MTDAEFWAQAFFSFARGRGGRELTEDAQKLYARLADLSLAEFRARFKEVNP